MRQPGFMFYPNDWMKDMMEHPNEIGGAWMKILCKLHWAEKYGELTRSITQWSKIIGEDEQNTARIINYIKEQGIGDVLYLSNECPAIVSIVSRRMKDDENKRVEWAASKRVQRMSNDCPKDVHQMSSLSSSSSSSSEDNIPPIVPPSKGGRKSRKYWAARVGTQEYIDHVKGRTQ